MWPSDRITLAFDRASVRSYDRDGRLHVEVSNISKAAVNPYLGREIPGAATLGLDPDRRYNLLRDPDELKRAAPSSNNLPILSEHVGVDVNNHRPELVIGSTGTDAKYEHPYLRNSLVFWSRDAVSDIERGAQRQLSCAYRYDPIMGAGYYDGQSYDGRMTNIIFNHVCLVPDGRAGPDVVVGDSALRRGTVVRTTAEWRAWGARYGARYAEAKLRGMAADAAVEWAEGEKPDATKVCGMLKTMFAEMEPAEVERVCQWVSAGKFGEDEEINLGNNDPTRRTGEMPTSAMDRAIALSPGLANIGIGAPGSYTNDGTHNGRRYGSTLTTKAMKEAEAIAPGLADIKFGAI